MVSTPSSSSTDKSEMKKGAWSAEEDRKLVAYVTRYGCWNWRQLPRFAGLSRCGKSCRLRWMNYLKPNIKRGNYSKEEDETILKLHRSMGNKWAAIAAHLPGRTDNGIKNYWNTSLKKRELEQDSIASKAEKASTSDDNSVQESARPADQQQLLQNLDDSRNSSQKPSSELHSNGITEEAIFTELVDDFWADPFLFETDSYFSTDTFSSFADFEYLTSQPDELLWDDSLFS